MKALTRKERNIDWSNVFGTPEKQDWRAELVDTLTNTFESKTNLNLNLAYQCTVRHNKISTMTVFSKTKRNDPILTDLFNDPKSLEQIKALVEELSGGDYMISDPNGDNAPALLLIRNPDLEEQEEMLAAFAALDPKPDENEKLFADII